MDLIYLDNNATTRPAPEVVEAMLPYLTEWYGNPSSVHRFGQRSRQAIDEARSQVAALIGCADSELAFTGGGTESVNTAIRGLLTVRSPRKRIITTTVEHSAARELCAALAKERAEIVEIPVDEQGGLDLDQLANAVDDSVALVTAMWANNETGVLFPVEQIAKLCRGRRVPYHCDATQAVGKIPVNVAKIGIDVMKLRGPQVSRAQRRGRLVLPPGRAGPAADYRWPAGTQPARVLQNVPGIVGMGRAAELAVENLPHMAQVAKLRDDLEGGILSGIEDAHINGRTDARLPNTTNIGFARLEAEAILLLLSEQGVCGLAGAACSSGSLEPSHVLRAMGIDDKVANGAIRFSLSRYTTAAEVDRTLALLPAVIERLRSVLPVG